MPLHEAISRSLGCLGDPKTMEMPEPQDIYQGELQTENRTCTYRYQSGKGKAIKPFDKRLGATVFRVFPARFSVLQFGIESYLVNMYSVPLYVRSMIFAFGFTGGNKRLS